MRIDLRSSPGTVSWEVDTTGVTQAASVDPKTSALHPFVSLYNREALFELGLDLARRPQALGVRARGRRGVALLR